MPEWKSSKKAEVKKRILRIANGFRYIVKLVSNNAPTPVIKEIEGKPSKVYPFQLLLIDIIEEKADIIREGLKTDYYKYMTIKHTELEEPEIYDIDLTPNLYNHIRKFILENKITTNDLFSIQKVGSDFWTKYLLLKEEQHAT